MYKLLMCLNTCYQVKNNLANSLNYTFHLSLHTDGKSRNWNLTHTISDPIHMYHDLIPFPIKRGSFFLHLQALESQKETCYTWARNYQKPVKCSIESSLFCFEPFPITHHLKLTGAFSYTETPWNQTFDFTIVNLWRFNWKGRYELNSWENKLPLSSWGSTDQKPYITLNLYYVFII